MYSLLHKKIRDPKSILLTYTLTPPTLNENQKEIDLKLANIEKLQRALAVDAINLPEVRNESRNPRVSQFVPRIEPREFAKLIKENIETPSEIIIDRGIVYDDWENQSDWMKQTLHHFDCKTILLVGGESSKFSYPGPSVVEAAKRIQSAFKDGPFEVLLGGITIPTRQNEAERILNKASGGIEFFISQVLYEAASTKKFFTEYHKLCEENVVTPGKILISLAPITSSRDVEFMRWWDVEIPVGVEEFILKEKSNKLQRSIETSINIVREILEFRNKNKLNIPLGINIEHVSTRNLNAAIEFAIEISSLYNEWDCGG